MSNETTPSQKPKPRKLFTPLRAVGAGILVAGLSGGILAAESTGNSQPTASLSNELKHPLSPLYTEASPNGYKVKPGQQAPVAETVSQVPGHKDEVEVQFGAETNGSIPPSEIVHGTIPTFSKPGDVSPQFNVGVPAEDIRPTPGVSSPPPAS